MLVLAGPGSGKTRVLTSRVAYLIGEVGIPPETVMAVTFTNKAAREMRTRVDALLAETPASPIDINLGTFHALCARMLRREAEKLPFTRSYVIFDDSDQLSLVRQTLKELNMDPKQIHPRGVHAAISNAKSELVSPKEYVASTYFSEVVRRSYERYQELLLQNNAVDFDDLLFWAVHLLREEEALRRRYRGRFAHILVDEFQDTNTAQYALLRLLAGKAPDLFVVGDADQSIYRWRGADYRNVQRFREDYPKALTILLEQNYRSTQYILDTGMAVIDRLSGREKKHLFTDRGPGSRVVIHEAYDTADEAQYVLDTIAGLTLAGEAAPGEVAVMYRTNAQSRTLEEAFMRAGLPYRLVGAQRFYGRREVKDVIAYLRLIHNPADQVSLLRVLNTPPRGVGAKTVRTLLELAANEQIAPSDVIQDMARGGDSEFREVFGARQAGALADFGSVFKGWIESRDTLPLEALVDQVLRDIGYQAYIEDDTEEGRDRWANVLELRAVAEEFSDIGLVGFLENVALVSDQDTLTEAQNAPILLTLHAAKGLEFKVVFIVGLDEGLLPHQRSFEDREAMAEERRLLYVGITRAQDRLYLVRAFRRRIMGTSNVSEASSFLLDIPPHLVEGNFEMGRASLAATYQRQTQWETEVQVPLEARFRVGMRVHHPAFGDGIVMDTRLDRNDEEVTVVFEGLGIKRLLGSIATLEILED